jgi:hypothetical protein
LQQFAAESLTGAALEKDVIKDAAGRVKEALCQLG